MREKQLNEFTNTGLNQLEKQPPDILTHIQDLGTLEALDDVRIRYASGCNVPSIGAPTGVSVLPFGGVSASEEMFNLLGVPSANCPSQNTQFYLDVFQKCSEFCRGNVRCERTTTFRGSPSSADVMRVYSESRKLKSTDAADVFQAYYALCSRGIGRRRSVNVRQTITVSSSNFIHNNEKGKLNDDKEKGKRIMKEVIIISDDDTSFDALVFSNSDSSNDSHDYMSEDSSEALINFLVGRS
ncbi:hypothetical protein Tco_1294837 [Tanacetum coccineum]